MSRLTLRIYYEDTDFSGFVYHARYLHFFERGRTEALREAGVDQRALFEAEGGPFAFVVRHMSIDYLTPARMDDMVSVETRVVEVGGASILMHQVLRRGEQVLARADVTIAHLRAGRPARLDPALKSAFIALQ
jgi:acyl-CoA thioester hydrolase